MNRLLGGRIRRPLTLVVALLSLTLALGTPVAANAAVRTPSHTVAKNDAGTMKSYVTGTASRGRTVVGVVHSLEVRAEERQARRDRQAQRRHPRSRARTCTA